MLQYYTSMLIYPIRGSLNGRNPETVLMHQIEIRHIQIHHIKRQQGHRTLSLCTTRPAPKKTTIDEAEARYRLPHPEGQPDSGKGGTPYITILSRGLVWSRGSFDIGLIVKFGASDNGQFLVVNRDGCVFLVNW